MTPTDPQIDPVVKAFCSLLFKWLNGEIDIGKQELAQRLFGILHGTDHAPPTPASVNRGLVEHGINIPIQYAITQKGPEIREEHLERFISELNQLKKRLPKPRTEAQRGKSHRSEERPCVKTAKTT